LEVKYTALKEASYTQETVLKKVVLLFDEALTQRLENGENTVKIFSKYISQIIAQAHKDSPEILSEALHETIAEIIASEVENNKDSMIDSLYPIMGGMISKYVGQMIQEMMETINKKVEEGLSFEAYTRKIRAKITGVSETDLLIRESNGATISSLLVIQKESGLLIAEAQLEDERIDAQMVASMASAIRDFINDWIQENKSQDEVQTLTYGDATLYIESAGSVYIIAFLDKDPSYELRREINTFFASIIKKYVLYFRRFDGDDSTQEVIEISMALQEYIGLHSKINKKKKKKKKNYAKLFFQIFLFVLISYGAYKGYIKGKEYLLEHHILENIGQEITITYREGKVIRLEGHVDTLSQIKEIAQMIEKEENRSIENHLFVGIETILNASKEEIKRLDININETRQVLINIKKRIHNEIKVSSIEKIFLKKEIDTQLKKHFENNEVYANLRLNFKHLSLFVKGKNTYSSKSIKILKKDFDSYMQVLLPYIGYIERIVIEGHSDSSGDKLANILLSERRALAIKKELWKTDTIVDYHLEGLLSIAVLGSSHAIKVNGIEDKKASRRIEIYFVWKKNHILDMLKKVVND
jgi:outer membrane protein OmpA-like peptidoglycan-associated protein